VAQREETQLDQEVFDKTLADELAKGTDRRVAEGRAKSAAIRAYRKVHGEPERERKAPAEREHAPAGAAAGDGGDGGVAAPAAAAVAAPGAPMYAPPPAAAVRTAPPPTGRVPTAARPGAPDKHRLLALVAPEGIQRVEREQGDRINVFPTC